MVQRLSVHSRPAWSTEGASPQPEKPCLEKEKEKQTKNKPSKPDPSGILLPIKPTNVPPPPPDSATNWGPGVQMSACTGNILIQVNIESGGQGGRVAVAFYL